MTTIPAPVPPRSSCLWSLVLIVLILAALAAFAVWRLQAGATELALSIQDRLAEVLHLRPEVSVHNRVIIAQPTALLELAVISREIDVERDREHAWLGSVKRLRMHGIYRVRAGFDLTQPYQVRVEGHRISVRVPPAKILSVDQVSAEVLSHENGFWNRINPQEVGTELARLPEEARAQAEQAGLKREALESLRTQLVEKFGPEWTIDLREGEAGGNAPNRLPARSD